MIAKASSRSFSVSIVLIDFVAHITLIQTVRYMVFGFSVLNTWNHNPEYVPERIPHLIVSVICVQFVVRKIAEILSLSAISSRVVRSYLFDFWTILDTCALGVAIALSAGFSPSQSFHQLWLQFAAVAFQWIKLLAFLRGINVELVCSLCVIRTCHGTISSLHDMLSNTLLVCFRPHSS